MFLRGIQRKYRTRDGMKIIRIGPSANYKNVNDKKTNAAQKTAFALSSLCDDGVRKTRVFRMSRTEQFRPHANVVRESRVVS